MKSNSKTETNNEYIKVGLISDGHGLRGDVYAIIFSGDVSWIDELEEIYLMPVGQTDPKKLKPFEVKKIKPFKKGFIAQLENVTDRNQSDALKKQEVWVPADLFISEDGDQPYLQELLDFAVQDKQLGLIGNIEDFSSNGEQDLFVLDKKINGQSIEIPFVKEFVIEIDYKNKKMMLDLPEGLIQINEKD